MHPRRGEVWLFDLGMTAKTRPVLVVSIEYGDVDRAIVTVVPHTTEIRQSPVEVPRNAPGPKKRRMDRYAAVATGQYKPQLLTRVGYVDLNALTSKVEQDVEIADRWQLPR